MREIKFRAWHDGLMYSVYEIDWKPTGMQVHMINESARSVYHADKALALMQYTGLTDRVGKEIYEGDIILRHVTWGNGLPEIVTYEHGRCSYSYDLVEFAEVPQEQWEVIGNIYETPDLVKQLDL